VCAHIPSTLWVPTFYIVFVATNTLEPMMQFVTPLPPLRKCWLHVGQEQLHALPLITFKSFRQWIDIVLTKDGICTLTNIVIVNPTWAHLLPQSRAIQRFVTSDVAQAKERSYRNQHPINQFLPLTIEIFGYLHKHADVFLHDCANVI
jgi:hypothetical protein